MKMSKKIILIPIIDIKLTLLGQSEPLNVKHDVHWDPFFKVLKMVLATFALEGVIKTQTSLSAHVWDDRIF